MVNCLIWVQCVANGTSGRVVHLRTAPRTQTGSRSGRTETWPATDIRCSLSSSYPAVSCHFGQSGLLPACSAARTCCTLCYVPGIMAEPDHIALLHNLDAAFESARQHVSELADLASSTSVSQDWSSQVTRCRTSITDAMKSCKHLLFHLEVMEEEEDGCATLACCRAVPFHLLRHLCDLTLNALSCLQEHCASITGMRHTTKRNSLQRGSEGVAERPAQIVPRPTGRCASTASKG